MSKTSASECVKVVLRCRPLNSKEREDGREKIVEMDTAIGQVVLHNPKGDNSEPPKSFTFDAVMPESITQKEVYDIAARPIVASALEGYNGTIFAYGQTGTGKTHTMDGGNTPELYGLIPRSFEHVFSEVEASTGQQWMVRAPCSTVSMQQLTGLVTVPCSMLPKFSALLK
jgi:hypothetical protein